MYMKRIFIGCLILAGFLNESNGLTSCNYGIGNSYKIVSCATGDTSYCQKTVVTYQVAMVEKRYCASTCTQDATGTKNGNYLTQTYCCQTDGCNLSLRLNSNKILTLVLLSIFFILF